MKLRNLFRTMLGRPADDLDAEYLSSSRHIVLGGCGRSGTTLARVILDSHPDICCGPESKVLLDEPLDAGRLAKRYKLESEQMVQARDDSESRGEFIDRFASMCCASSGKRRWAEKTPRNVLNLRWIFDHFPETRFVHLLRDGRDVACSLRTHPRHKVVNGKLVPLDTWRPMEECADRWRDSLVAVQPFLTDPRVHTVRYEHLVAEPEVTTRRLLEFLGEPWDPRVLAHSEAESRFRDATTFPQNPEALRPIDRSAMHRWERDMTPDDRRVFKHIAGDLLVEYGYAAGQDW